MALYIHPENQELLWKVVNKNPMIQDYFMRYPQNIKETWFKQIVSAFYERNRNVAFNADNLYEINKDTLNYMVQDVKRNIAHMQEQQSIQRSQPPLTGVPARDEKKEEKFMSQYNQFQNNYYSMFDKKPPDSIDFREKFNDPPVSGNMEDLVQKHLRERDEELKKYAPAPFFGGQAASPSQTPISNGGRLTINQNENVQLAIEEVPVPEFARNMDDLSSLNISKLKGDDANSSQLQHGYEKEKTDLSVKWLDNENLNRIQSLEQEITILKNQVLQMTDKVAFLINANQEIFDFSAQRLRMNPITISGGFLFDPSSFTSTNI